MTPILGIQHLSSEVVPPSLVVMFPAQSHPRMQSRREGLAGAGWSGGWASRGTIGPHSLPEAARVFSLSSWEPECSVKGGESPKAEKQIQPLF